MKGDIELLRTSNNFLTDFCVQLTKNYKSSPLAIIVYSLYNHVIYSIK